MSPGHTSNINIRDPWGQNCRVCLDLARENSPLPRRGLTASWSRVDRILPLFHHDFLRVLYLRHVTAHRPPNLKIRRQPRTGYMETLIFEGASRLKAWQFKAQVLWASGRALDVPSRTRTTKGCALLVNLPDRRKRVLAVAKAAYLGPELPPHFLPSCRVWQTWQNPTKMMLMR